MNRLATFAKTLLWVSLLLLWSSSCHLHRNAGPAATQTLRVLSYNTYYVFSKGTQVEAATAWIAGQTPQVVALQELTAGWGHPHSALLKTSGFSVGLTSTEPIEIVDRIMAGMHHGSLHARIDGIHYFVVHLSPFQWTKRDSEADILLGVIKPLLAQGEPVIALGDFNALSSADQSLLEAQPEALERSQASDAKHDHVQNLRDGRFDYTVMQKFFDAGLHDASLSFLQESKMTRWTIPTGIWTEEKTTPPKGGTRIDFLLADPSLADSAVSAQIIRNGVVNRTSDHYPVMVEFHVDPQR